MWASAVSGMGMSTTLTEDVGKNSVDMQVIRARTPSTLVEARRCLPLLLLRPPGNLSLITRSKVRHELGGAYGVIAKTVHHEADDD